MSGRPVMSGETPAGALMQPQTMPIVPFGLIRFRLVLPALRLLQRSA